MTNWCPCEACQRAKMHVITQVSCFAIILAVVLAAAAFVKADQPKPSARWRGYEKALARVVVAEADGSAPDWAAILWTLDHRIARYGDTPARTMSYSVTTHSPLPRAQAIQLQGFKETDDLRSKQLVSALGHVRQWIEGSVPDPCPEALHWHGTTDAKPRWFEDVNCGPTRNTFGRLRLKR